MLTSKASRFQALALPLLVILILAFGGIAVRSSHHPNECETDPSADHGAKQEQASESLWCPSSWLPITTFTCFLAVATGGLWIFTALLWLATNKAVADGDKAVKAATASVDVANRHANESARMASAYEEANRIGRETLIAHRRAWLMPRATLSGPLIYDPNTGNPCVDLTFEIRNVGKSPATKVILDVELTVHGEETARANIIVSQMKLAKHAREQKSPIGAEIIFPGESHIQRFRMALMRVAIDAIIRKKELMRLTLIGCVDYDFPSGRGHHQTWVAYDIFKQTDAGVDWLDPADGDLPIESLEFSKCWISQQHAD